MLVQDLARMLNLRKQGSGKTFRPLMIDKAFVVMTVPGHVIGGICALLLLSSEGAVLLFLVFEQIAIVIATGSGAVIRPSTHANPAELMLAGGAPHVIATLILLDLCVARLVRARLSIGDQPGCVLTLIAFLLYPLLGGVTVTRPVRDVPAAEAIFRTAVAMNLLKHHDRVSALTSKLTFGGGAPANIRVLIGEGLDEPLPVLVIVLL